MSQPSKACCSIPAVTTGAYDGKGEYIKLNDMKTYHTGPKDSKHGIFVIPDIFGYFPQTIQGADILAYSDDDRKYQVFIPDFFDGEPADIKWFPPGDDKEKQAKLGAFFKNQANGEKALGRIGPLVEAIKKEHGVETLAILGYCWGGKMAGLACGEGTSFVAGASVHPASVDPADAAKITVPFAMLASSDEPKDAVEKWEKAITKPTHVEIFSDQIHGWMGARSDLSKDRVKEEYERGYRLVLEFFHQHA